MPSLRYLQAINQALLQEMERDPSLCYLGEDVRVGLRGASSGLFDRFGPERVLDTPISEAAFTGFATGLAMLGFRAVVEYQITSLLYVAFDQIVNQAQKLRSMTGGQAKVPVTYLLIASGARQGLSGQHSDHPYPFLLQAGVKTVLPSTPYDAKGLLLTSIRDDDPVAYFAPAACLPLRGEVPEDAYTIPLGKGAIRRVGWDATVVATGHLVQDALRVAEELQETYGLSLEIYDPRSLFPWDKELLAASVRKTRRVIIYDDSAYTCGFSAEVAAFLAEELLETLASPVRRVARINMPVPFAPNLEQYVLPSKAKLRHALLTMFGLAPVEGKI